MANYWIKLYHKMLRDPDIGRLPDSLKWRWVSVLLMAGETNEGGYLPPIEDMAWTLRTDGQTLRAELSQLAQAFLVELKEDVAGCERWFVTNFARLQAPSPAAERMREYRKRKKAEEKKESDIDTDTYRTVTRVTQALRNVTEDYAQLCWSYALAYFQEDGAKAEQVLQAQSRYAEVVGLKQPYLNGDRQTVWAAQKEWWIPLEAMLTEVDNDLSHFETYVKRTIEAARRGEWTLSTPKSAQKTFSGLVGHDKRTTSTAGAVDVLVWQEEWDNAPTY